MRASFALALLAPSLASCSSVDPATRDALRDITITRVSLQQGVDLTLVKDGAEILPPYASPIAERAGMLRVEFTPSFSDIRAVTAQLVLDYGEGVTTLKEVVNQVDGSNIGQSTNFELDANDLKTNTKFRVRFVPGPTGSVTGSGSPAEYPPKAAPPAEFRLQRSGTLRIKLIPIRYDTDGSGRIADSGPTHVEELKKRFLDLYPVTSVDITVGDPLPWSQKIGRNGEGHDDLLDEIAALRAQESPDFDVYYLGLFATTATYAEYCGHQCTTGLSVRATNARSAESRVSVAVGYAETRSMESSLHEIGHAHGRAHAPCGGAGNPDASFPHEKGTLGAEGYSALAKKFYDPAKNFDFMSYCDPAWVSDYTFGALLTRVQELTTMEAPQHGLVVPKIMRMLQVRPSGETKWGRHLRLAGRPNGEPIGISLTAQDGQKSIVTGYKYDYLHSSGGTVWVPSAEVSGKRVELVFNDLKIELDGADSR